MSFLGLMLRAGLRHRWRSWLALALLTALVVGLVLAGAQTARRTATAFSRFEALHGYDATSYSATPATNLGELSSVATTTQVLFVGSGPPTCQGCRPVRSNNFSVTEVPPRNLGRLVKLVAGRMPDQSDAGEVLASYTLVPYGIHVGSVLHLPLASPSQRGAILENLNVAPNGPVATVRVVGLAASEFEFPGVQTPSYDVYTTAGFAQAYNARTVTLYEYFYRLHHGAAGLPKFEAMLRQHGEPAVVDLDAEGNTIATSIAPQAVGWWILTCLAALVGIVVLVQALLRQAAVEAEDFPALDALGASRRQLFSATMARTLIVALAGAAAGVGLALLLSVYAPVGEARLADPAPGFNFDPLLLLGGAAVAVALVLALGVWPALSSARRATGRDEGTPVHASRTVNFLSSSGAPPSMLIGVRHALERGRGRSAIPVGSAMLGLVLGVAVLCATAVFGASLNQLTSNPSQYGQGFDAWFSVNTTGSLAQNQTMLDAILRRPGIAAITAGVGGAVTIDGKLVDAIAGDNFRGPLLIPLTGGRYPASDHEVVLGSKTLNEVGAHIGSTVQVALPDATGSNGKARPFQVVGTVVLPPDFNTQGLGTGAIFTVGALSGSSCHNGTDHSCVLSSVLAQNGALLVRAAPDAQGRAALRSLGRTYSNEILYPSPPTNLVNFGESINFPLIFGVIVVLFGATTLLHLLLSSLNRRRRDVGLLKSLGLYRRQVAFSVAWQTTTLAVVGIIIGVPVGIAAGRAVWSAFADNLGVATQPVVAATEIALLVVGTLVVANLLALVPAFLAARERPASLLRSE
jgi:ABC-type lipoprotein release transport system permease subunit